MKRQTNVPARQSTISIAFGKELPLHRLREAQPHDLCVAFNLPPRGKLDLTGTIRDARQLTAAPATYAELIGSARKLIKIALDRRQLR